MSRQLPTLRPGEVIRALERAGFRLLRVKGSSGLKRHASTGRRPDRAVWHDVGAGCSRVPALAALPRAPERRMIGVRSSLMGNVGYNGSRGHSSLGGQTPNDVGDDYRGRRANVRAYRWAFHCGGLYQLLMVAQLHIHHPHPSFAKRCLKRLWRESAER